MTPNNSYRQQPPGYDGQLQHPTQGGYPGSTPAKKSSAGLVIGIAIVVAVLLVGAGAGAYFFLSDDDDSGNGSSSAQDRGTQQNKQAPPERNNELRSRTGSFTVLLPDGWEEINAIDSRVTAVRSTDTVAIALSSEKNKVHVIAGLRDLAEDGHKEDFGDATSHMVPPNGSVGDVDGWTVGIYNNEEHAVAKAVVKLKGKMVIDVSVGAPLESKQQAMDAVREMIGTLHVAGNLTP